MDYACYISKTSWYINIGESGLNIKFSKINQSMEDRATCPIWRTTAWIWREKYWLQPQPL